MILKIKRLSEFKWLLLIGLFFIACQNELTENEKFERFAEQYEKMVVRVFPERVNLSDNGLDSLTITDLNRVEILHRVDFCLENLDKLSTLELKEISPENTKQLKSIFAQLKLYLRDLEKAANIKE
mgnify:CR=1 FL=1